MTEKTSVPIGWIFGIVGAMITAFAFAGGIIVWGASLDARSATAVVRIAKIETVQDQYGRDQSEIKESLARIEGYLKVRR